MRILRLLFLIFLSARPCLATVEPLEEHLSQYTRHALVSEYTFQDLKAARQGVLTLVFCPQKRSYDHAALVFEYLTPDMKALNICLVHYGNDDDSSRGNGIVIVDNFRSALAKMLGGHEQTVRGASEQRGPKYTKYASWLLPHDNLIEVLTRADEDSKLGHGEVSMDGAKSHCVNYAATIMRRAGLRVEFSRWKSNTPDHLRSLIREESVQPKYHKRWWE